ncbi:MAG: hypoxanthine phosphoribosyltransferase [Desulfobacteraceae bacterium]|jgi:hypoxanthine phosphoribosyltransferase|nr:MAG: hypoxanthine phosphoribosyltransferase [Desulfobacteraceae bacterium]
MQMQLLISKEAIKRRVRELASQIASDHSGRELVLVGILKGAVFFFSDLARELGVPARIDFVRAASYGSLSTSSGTVTLIKDIELSVENRSVVLVEDIVDTGLTLACIVEELKKKNPLSLKVCVLVDKLERRKVEIPVDYCGFRIESGFVVGYGLDYDEQYRNLSEIYALQGDFPT